MSQQQAGSEPELPCPAASHLLGFPVDAPSDTISITAPSYEKNRLAPPTCEALCVRRETAIAPGRRSSALGRCGCRTFQMEPTVTSFIALEVESSGSGFTIHVAAVCERTSNPGDKRACRPRSGSCGCFGVGDGAELLPPVPSLSTR